MSEQNLTADVTQSFSCWRFETNVPTTARRNQVKSMDDRKADTIYELLHAQAERGPDAAAIVAPGRDVLSYQELFGQVGRGCSRVAWQRRAAYRLGRHRTAQRS